jgi:23S rRNA pseudouridine1911/1915/1917 synthase
VAEAPDERAESSAPEDIPLQVVYEDDCLIVLDKPAGWWFIRVAATGAALCSMLCCTMRRNSTRCRGPGIVHRLDKDTSGLMVVAKTLEAQTDLVGSCRRAPSKRCYQALVRGIVERAGTVDAPIGRHPTLRTSMAVVRTGKPARTHYRVLERFLACTLIECALETGRTHQIRVHMTSDRASAGRRPGLRRRCQPRAARPQNFRARRCTPVVWR